MRLIIILSIVVLAATTITPFDQAAAFVFPTPAVSPTRSASNCRTTDTRTLLNSAVADSTSTKAQQPVDAIRYRGDPSDPKCNCDDEYDAIVIGSGIGGMTTASLLAQSKERLKVLLLEQHSVCGGCCHAFKRGGYTFPTGIHYIGDMKKDDRLRKMLDALTYDPENDPLIWDPIDNNFDTVVLGSDNDLRHYKIVGGGIEAQARQMKEQFPADTHDAIDAYYSHIEKASASFERGSILKSLPLPLTRVLRVTGAHRLIDGGFRKYASKTLAEVVNSLTDNEDLRAAMTYCWDDYGCEPSRASFIVHAVVVKHYSRGAFFPRGGPGNIAKKIIPSITAAGGAALASAPVKRIVLDEDTAHAVGVEMKDGRVIRAKRAVVSDAGVTNTLLHLLPTQMKRRQKLIKKFFQHEKDGKAGDQHNHLHDGASSLNLFVGLKGDHDTDFNLPHGQLWAFPDASVEEHLKMVGALSLKEAVETLEPKDIGLVFVGSSACKDSAWKDEHPGRTTLEIMACAPWKWFEQFAPNHDENLSAESMGASDPGGIPGSHGLLYKEAKEELSRMIWSRTVDILSSFGATNLPQTLDGVDYHELGTPLTYAHYYWKEGGAFYGLDHDLARFAPRNFYEVLRPEVREVPGLYLTGQDISSCGFGGAMVGGVLCAGKILGAKNPFSVLEEIEANH